MMRCAACGAEFQFGKSAPQDGTSAAEQALICASCEQVAQRSSAGRRHSPPSESVATHDAPPLSFSSEPADDLDECEILLRRAIEMVRGAVHRPRPASEAPNRASDAPHELAASQPLDRMASASIPSVAERELDECELLLGRAIAMVRGPVRRTRPVRGLTDVGPVGSTPPSGSVRVERLPASRAVAIQHDARGGYVAVDATTGLSLLRHQDAGQLGIMCDRIGWQVIGNERPRAGG